MRKRFPVLLLVLIGAVFATGPAVAQVPVGDTGTPMGGDDEGVRVRERNRMRREYEEMRDNRAKALREARLSTAGSAGEQIPGWRGTGAAAEGGRTADAPAPEAVAEENDSSGVRPLEGAPKYLLYFAVGLLGVVIVVRFRRGR